MPSDEYPTGKEYVHWLVVNIPGYDVGMGETLFEYNSTTTVKPQGNYNIRFTQLLFCKKKCTKNDFTGPNRYVFLLYEQPNKMTFGKSRWDRK